MNSTVKAQILLLAICFLVVSIVVWFIKLSPDTAPPKDIELNFNQGKVNFSFIPQYKFETGKSSENVYELDKSNIVRNYKISFYPDLDSLSAEKFYKRESINGLAGEGCIDQKKKFYFYNYAFWQAACYYNPIELDKSGEYNPQISVVTQKACYYQLPKQKGFIYIDGVAAQGLDLCDSIKELFKFIIIK